VRPVAAPVIAMLLLCAAGGGCQTGSAPSPAATSQPSLDLKTLAGLSTAQFSNDVQAECLPPLGWAAQPLKRSARHTHQIWISPTGRTAYGVIHFTMPLPVGYDLALWFFMNEMRRSEGESKLTDKRWDPNLRGLRFVAQGGLYTVRANMLLRGFEGWAIYAGTLTGQPVIPEELDLAEQARECTRVDHPSDQP
jgi:hypothetical protein